MCWPPANRHCDGSRRRQNRHPPPVAGPAKPCLFVQATSASEHRRHTGITEAHMAPNAWPGFTACENRPVSGAETRVAVSTEGRRQTRSIERRTAGPTEPRAASLRNPPSETAPPAPQALGTGTAGLRIAGCPYGCRTGAPTPVWHRLTGSRRRATDTTTLVRQTDDRPWSGGAVSRVITVWTAPPVLRFARRPPAPAGHRTRKNRASVWRGVTFQAGSARGAYSDA